MDSIEKKSRLGTVEIVVGGIVIVGIGALGYWTATRMSATNEEVCQLKKRVEVLEKSVENMKKGQSRVNKDVATKLRTHTETIEEMDVRNKIETMQQSLQDFEETLSNFAQDEETPSKKKKSVKPSPKSKPKKVILEKKKPKVNVKDTESDEEESDIDLDDIYAHL